MSTEASEYGSTGWPIWVATAPWRQFRSSDHGSQPASSKDSRSGNVAYQNLPWHWYGYPPSQQPFPGAPQFYHNSPFNMTQNCSQPTTSVSQCYPSYGPQWEGYDLHQGGYGESQMFPQQQFPEHGPSSPGEPRVPPGLPGNNPVDRPTSSSCTATPGHTCCAPGRPLISLPTKRFLPPAEPLMTDVTRMVDLPPLPEISYVEYDADDESDDSSDFGGAEGKPPVSLNQTEFSFRQFGKRMGQGINTAFNKWKKVWVAGLLEEKHLSIVQGQTCLKQLRDGPLHWETAVADFVETFETWCRSIISIILNQLFGSGWRCFSRNVQVKFGSWGKREGKATCDRRQMWESAWAKRWQVSSQSCQIQLSWLWCARCWMPTISFYPQTNSKPRIPMWGTGRSWLISSTKTDAQKGQRF